jgi:hypothetical protein
MKYSQDQGRQRRFDGSAARFPSFQDKANAPSPIEDLVVQNDLFCFANLLRLFDCPFIIFRTVPGFSDRFSDRFAPGSANPLDFSSICRSSFTTDDFPFKSSLVRFFLSALSKFLPVFRLLLLCSFSLAM